MGLRLLAEPRTLQDPGRTDRRAGRIPQAQAADRQHRDGLVVLAGRRLGFARFRQGAFPRSEGHGRPRPRQPRADHDLGVAQVLSEHRQLQGAGRQRLHVQAQRRGRREGLDRPGLHCRRSTIRTPKEARDIYWRQIDEKLNVLGIDAWWMDADEPDLHSNLDIGERKARTTPTAVGPSTEFFNSYPLPHTQGVYEGSRAKDPDKRVFILSRKGYAGTQRNAVAVWSGDVVSRWDDLRDQISAGVNISMSGQAELDVRHRRLRGGEALRKPGSRAPAGMARTQPALVPVRRVRADLPLARPVPVSRDLEHRARKARRSTTAWSTTTSCVTRCCRTSTRWPATPTIATAS